HTIRAGGNLSRTTMDGNAAANKIQIIEEITYRNQPGYRLTDWDGGVFLQDGWEPIRTFRIDAGIRIDRQRLARATTAAPRLGVAWTPEKGGRTVLRGGIGSFYDHVPLAVFAFPNYPWRMNRPNRIDYQNGLAP